MLNHPDTSPALSATLVPLVEALCAELETAPLPLDPYWPKWDRPWWQLSLLREMQQLHRLSAGVFERFAQQIETHYLPFFPLTEAELPPGLDPYREILCHCALGNALLILQAGGLDPWTRWPWLSVWFERYQLPAGGYNCDEAVYTGSGRSSPVSTLPMLEALLTKNTRTAAEDTILAQGMQVLLRRKLFQSSQGQPLDPRWLQPLFPRFYHYDLLQAVALVLHWSQQSGVPLPAEALAPALSLLRQQAATGLQAQAWYPAAERTLAFDGQHWQRGQAVLLFPLLQAFVDQPALAQPWLAQTWQQIEGLLAALALDG